VSGFRLDEANAVHARALARLRTEQIGWLGSTGRDGFPHAVPVWFLWHCDAESGGGAALVFSQPGAAKVKNLRADPRALFHLEAGADGEQLQVLQGTAELSAEPTAVWLDRVREAYLAKYGAGIERLGSTAASFAADYSTTIVVRPHKLIAW
jgi:PPOX class probable F420-dependent enzyme